MKARAVKGVDPARTVAWNAARIVRVRLDELHSFDPDIRDATNVVQLHDMRIAAKRLRYVLEILGHCFGAVGQRAEDEARWVQEILGEIHDCDVLIPRVEDELERRRGEDADALVARSAGDPRTLPALLVKAPNARLHRGLVTLDAGLRARRRLLYAEFVERWDRLLAEGARERLERACERAERTGA